MELPWHWAQAQEKIIRTSLNKLVSGSKLNFIKCKFSTPSDLSVCASTCGELLISWFFIIHCDSEFFRVTWSSLFNFRGKIWTLFYDNSACHSNIPICKKHVRVLVYYNLSPTAASVLVIGSHPLDNPPSKPQSFSSFSANPSGPHPSSSLIVWPPVGFGQRKVSSGG